MFRLEAHFIILDILSVVKRLIYISHVQSHLIPNNLCCFSFSFAPSNWGAPGCWVQNSLGPSSSSSNLAVQGRPCHLSTTSPMLQAQRASQFPERLPFHTSLRWFTVCPAGSLFISGPAHHPPSVQPWAQITHGWNHFLLCTPNVSLVPEVIVGIIWSHAGLKVYILFLRQPRASGQQLRNRVWKLNPGGKRLPACRARVWSWRVLSLSPSSATSEVWIETSKFIFAANLGFRLKQGQQMQTMF